MKYLPITYDMSNLPDRFNAYFYWVKWRPYSMYNHHVEVRDEIYILF